MNYYPTEEMSFKKLFRRSIRLHYVTLKQVIPYLLVITFVKYMSILFETLFSDPVFQIINYIICTLVIVYFFAVSLFAAHLAFSDQPKSMTVVMKTIWHRMITIYITFFIYSVGIFAIYFFTTLIVENVTKLMHVQLSPSSAIFAADFLCMVFIALFYFCFPIAIIDSKPVKKAFYEAVLLGEKNKFGILISICVLVFVHMLMMPQMLHEHLLSVYHLDALFDFVVLCVAIPLYINLILLLINDSKVIIKVGDAL